MILNHWQAKGKQMEIIDIRSQPESKSIEIREPEDAKGQTIR